MAFVSIQALRHACPVCRREARVPCDGCYEVFYCSVYHRNSDHRHQAHCANLKGRVSKEIVRKELEAEANRQGDGELPTPCTLLKMYREVGESPICTRRKPMIPSLPDPWPRLDDTYRLRSNTHRLMYESCCRSVERQIEVIELELKAAANGQSVHGRELPTSCTLLKEYEVRKLQICERGKRMIPSSSPVLTLVENLDRFRSKMKIGFNPSISDCEVGFFEIFMDKRTGELVGMDAASISYAERNKEGYCFRTHQESSSYAWRVDVSQLESFEVMVSRENGMMRKHEGNDLPYINSFIEGYNCMASFVTADLVRLSQWRMEDFCDRTAAMERFPWEMGYRWGSACNTFMLFLGPKS